MFSHVSYLTRYILYLFFDVYNIGIPKLKDRSDKNLDDTNIAGFKPEGRLSKYPCC